MRTLLAWRAPLVDVLIGAILLVLLAATAVPLGFARERDLRDVLTDLDLEMLRSQIETWRIEHEGRYPGSAGTADEFRRHLLSRTDRTGKSAGGNRTGRGNAAPQEAQPEPLDPVFGPYFHDRLPANAWTGGRGVQLVDDVDAAWHNPTARDRGEPIGWLYSPRDGRVRAVTYQRSTPTPGP